MKRKTYRKDYFISVLDDKVIICKNAEGNPKTLEEINNSKLRFLYEVGQKILTPFGVETIKDIDYDYGSLTNHHGYEWLITVEENGNQYKPIELIGIFVKEITLSELNNLINI